MSKTLVIVESPTKARTISKFLGSDFMVESSMGHVRDLPKSNMGVDIESGSFEPVYEIPTTKKKVVTKLKKLAKDADEILFATDEDREGEAISWHLATILKIPADKVKRLVFHEITKSAINDALAHPRPLKKGLVDAQQARRVLDRLVGYELSPLLWKKVRYGLSAGRVQSVAVHLIVKREHERKAFHAATYFDIKAHLAKAAEIFDARLTQYNKKPIPSGKDFDARTGTLKKPEAFATFTEKEVADLAESLEKTTPWTVKDVTETPYKTHPYPPFITSTLQQEASRKLGWGARQTMRVAQSLYEKGHITYMRTDSVHLSSQAVAAAREAAKEFGDKYVAEKPKQFSSKSKLAQEAHEAIRPAGASFTHPKMLAQSLESDEAKLYELIWKRTVATQMKSAQLVRVSAQITVEQAMFEAKGKRISFAGYLRAYVEGADDPEADLDDKEITLPALSAGDLVEPKEVLPETHTTQPPARYTEASLIKVLEAEGVGRPSTYANILHTIMEREYVRKTGNALVPTYTAMIVDAYLQKHFDQLVDVPFTSSMEEDLDKIAQGEEEWQPYIDAFYHGKKGYPFHEEIEKAAASDEYPTITLSESPLIVIKSGKYGPYVQRGEGGEGNTASLPDNITPAELDAPTATSLIERAAAGPQVLAQDPETGRDITFRTGRYGPYLQLGEDGDDTFANGKPKKAKKVALSYGPKRTPLSASIDPMALSAEDAIRVMSLPRTLGEIDGVAVTASIGRFGPYLKRDDDFRSLPKDHDLLTVTLEEAQVIFAQEKKTRGRKKATVLKELGEDPKSKKTVQVLDGRYGPYVSNGTRTFASLPKDTDPEMVTLEQALGWIAEKKAGKRKRK